jgi:hypothetical protein
MISPLLCPIESDISYRDTEKLATAETVAETEQYLYGGSASSHVELDKYLADWNPSADSDCSVINVEQGRQVSIYHVVLHLSSGLFQVD